MKLVKISSVWCPSCLIMHSRYQLVSKQYNINIEEYDYDTDTDVVEKYKIGDILPVVIVMNNDVEVKRIIGEKSEKELRKIFEELEV